MDEREALMNLGLSRGATEDEIRSAHKKAARAVHPDHGSEALMASLNEARDVALSAIRGRRLPMRLVQDLVLSQTRVLEQSEAARLYPEVFVEFAGFQSLCGDVRVLPTPVFFWGLREDEELALEIEHGIVVIVRFLAVGEPDSEGLRSIFFELNGQPREVKVRDRSLAPAPARREADADDPSDVAAPCGAWSSRSRSRRASGWRGATASPPSRR